MLIDWFTVGAQALNFIILVWLMKRFLYKPVVDAIDAREKRIAAEQANAQARELQAQQERDELAQKNATFDAQRAERSSELDDQMRTERRRLLEEARQQAEAVSAKRHQALMVEARNLSEALVYRTQQEIFAIARKVLRDLADATLDESMAELFMRRLRDMDGEPKESLIHALRGASEPALVQSAFDLPAAQRAAVTRVISETFAADLDIRFETAPKLIGGIALTVNGQKVAWSIDEYLDSLEKSVVELVQAAAPAAPAAPALNAAAAAATAGAAEP